VIIVHSKSLTGSPGLLRWHPSSSPRGRCSQRRWCPLCCCLWVVAVDLQGRVGAIRSQLLLCFQEPLGIKQGHAHARTCANQPALASPGLSDTHVGAVVLVGQAVQVPRGTGLP
jgi:hypothetical protein